MNFTHQHYLLNIQLVVRLLIDFFKSVKDKIPINRLDKILSQFYNYKN